MTFSKSDVMNLLESAGFSRSNPYYIVKQGKVWILSNSWMFFVFFVPPPPPPYTDTWHMATRK